ncbi:MAG: PAS domain S-box protein [Spirochaetia bacterium]|jgi:PAS domain S-box-containing protein
MERACRGKNRRSALRIVGIYAAFAAVWIYFSDNALTWLSMEPSVMVRISVLKGFLYILVTAVLLYQLISRRISQSLREEAAASRSEARYRALFNGINDAVFVHGLTAEGLPGRIFEVNDIACNRLGFSREDLLSMSPGDLDAPETTAAVPSMMQRLRAEGHALWEGIHVARDGRRIPVEISNHLVELEGEEVILSTVRDITARRELEDTLSRGRMMLQTLIDNLPDFVSVKDSESRILIANTANARALGRETAGAVIGGTDFDFFPAEEAARYRADEKAVIETGEPLINKEEESSDWQGGRRWTLTTKVPLRDARGKIVGVVCTGRDITGIRAAEEALRKSEERLIQAQKMEAIGRLAGGIAHDFNNLLTVISGYAAVIDQGLPMSHEMKTDVREIRRASARAAELTAQLLAFSRRQDLQTRVLGPRAAVAGLENMLQRIIGEDIALSLRLDPETGNVRADPGKIAQVIMNLAVNSRDAMPSGGSLTIETGNLSVGEGREHGEEVTPGDYVVLTVTDTGVGMDAATFSRLFEPFFTTKESGKGTGLGLATVYGIVKQSGGFISCRSSPGAGAAFTILLPRVYQDAEEVAATPTAPVEKRGTETILLVEDEEALRAFSRSVLVKNGYVVIEAADGEEAMGIVAAPGIEIHLLLTDVVMPRMGGPELVKKALSSRPSLKVLCMSGYAECSPLLPGLEEMGIRLLQKPFDAGTLLSEIRKVLGAAGWPIKEV